MFLDIVEGRAAPGGKVELDIEALVRRIATSTGLPAGAAGRLPPNLARIQILQSDKLATVQGVVTGFRDMVWVLIVLAVAAFAGAIALAGDHRRSVVSVPDASGRFHCARLVAHRATDAPATAASASIGRLDAGATGVSTRRDSVGSSFG